jgi:peptidoglycan-associated lipoprotein
MKQMFLPLILTFSLAITSCSSKKTANKTQNSDSQSESLILNGDSDSGTAGKLKTAYFAYNSVSMDSSAKNTLTSNAEYLKKNPSIMLQIEGHCDERGGRQFNLALGDRRAKAVKEYLIALGIKAYRLKTLSWGNEKPVNEGSDDEAWSQNRRGNFVILQK